MKKVWLITIRLMMFIGLSMMLFLCGALVMYIISTVATLNPVTIFQEGGYRAGAVILGVLFIIAYWIILGYALDEDDKLD